MPSRCLAQRASLTGDACHSETLLAWATIPQRRLKRAQSSAFLFAGSGGGGSSSSTTVCLSMKGCRRQPELTAFSGVAAGVAAAGASPAAGLAQGVGANAANAAKASQDDAEGAGQYEADKVAHNFQLLFVTNAGKEVMLDHRSLAGCQRSCEFAPEMRPEPHEDAEMPMKAQTEIADVSPENDKKACHDFCSEQFKLSCFPSESTVFTRCGHVTMASLAVGDEVMVTSGKGTMGNIDKVHFEPVIAFLHRAPEMKFGVLAMRHEAGTLHISPEHLVYVRTHVTGYVQPALACEVREGDEIQALWLDGSLVFSRVKQITMVTRVGAYAPLVRGGTLLVDGAVVSCYALPLPVRASLVFEKLREACGMGAVAAVSHALFMPLRLAFDLGALSSRLQDSWTRSLTKDESAGTLESLAVQAKACLEELTLWPVTPQGQNIIQVKSGPLRARSCSNDTDGKYSVGSGSATQSKEIDAALAFSQPGQETVKEESEEADIAVVFGKPEEYALKEENEALPSKPQARPVGHLTIQTS